MKKITDCRVIAHRGASAYFPENTVLSFQKAIEMNAHMIELDVSFSRDRVPVVIHDDSINRTTDGKGKVSSYTYSELRKFDAGRWKGRLFNKEKIPSLQEVFELCSGKIPVNVEIKTEAVSENFNGGIEEAVLETAYASGMIDHIVISSFDPRALMNMHEIDRTIPTASLYEKHVLKKMDPVEITSWLNCGAFNCSVSQINRRWLDLCSENKINVNVYTVDSRKKMKQLFLSGVTGIFSNKPDVLLDVYESLEQLHK
ncbi:MAG: hypothetical protein JW982_17100 [Spirochaetes bacterium]|nr:hypothetical protein [Spirochaetota bacterium]